MSSRVVSRFQMVEKAAAFRHAGGVIIAGLSFLFLIGSSGLLSAASAPTDTLVLVNQEPITAEDLDRMVMEAHRSFDMEKEQSGIIDKLLNKRINDILIVQDALTAGMDEEPEMLRLMDEQRRKYATENFVKENLTLLDAPPPASVRAYFERYYWQIQIRRISVRTREEAEALRFRVVSGEDMGALASELSLDTKKLSGGLYNLLYWADLENRIRDHVGGLEIGEVSDIFPYNDAFSFVRVEQRLPVDESAYARVEKKIIAAVHSELNQAAWESFVDQVTGTMNMSEDAEAISEVKGDSAIVITGNFLNDNATPVIMVTDGPSASEAELRKAISHEVMQNGLRPFEENFAEARKRVRSKLALAHAAKRAGYFESSGVEKRVAADMEQALIEQYLEDTVASRITFNRAEFDEFYKENQEKFRGVEEVKLDIMIIEEQSKAEEAAQRLAEGADFGFIFAEYNPGQEATLGESAYIGIDQLSKPFRDQLENLKVGQSSQAVKMSMGWMIFKLAGRRPGTVAPMESVEMDIRRVIFQKKFNRLLDEHLELLKERSEINRWPDRIEAYLLAGSAGG